MGADDDYIRWVNDLLQDVNVTDEDSIRQELKRRGKDPKLLDKLLKSARRLGMPHKDVVEAAKKILEAEPGSEH